MYYSWNPWFREHVVNPHNRRRLRNCTASILCNNCVGAVMAHDLGLQLRSPFVNLWLYPKDYIRFCENMGHYLNTPLKFTPPVKINGEEIKYPIGKLDDITIYFMHYATEEEARRCWEKRKARIDTTNIYGILVERDGCTKEDLIRFSKLPFPTASLVHKPMPEVCNSQYISGFEGQGEVGDTILFKQNHYFGHRYFDDFDFVNFLNRK